MSRHVPEPGGEGGESQGKARAGGTSQSEGMSQRKARERHITASETEARGRVCSESKVRKGGGVVVSQRK